MVWNVVYRRNIFRIVVGIVALLLVLVSIADSALVTHEKYFDYAVPYLRQLDYSDIGESACAPTSITMLLRYYFPNSGVDVPEVYHSGIQGYFFNGPAVGYKSVSFQPPNTGLSIVDKEFRGYYKGDYSGLRSPTAATQYLNWIWGGESHVYYTSFQNVINEIKKGPLILNINYNNKYAHYVVLRGYRDAGTPNDYSDDKFYVNDPYTNWKGYPNGENREFDYDTLSSWYKGRIIIFDPSLSDLQRRYTIVVDNSHVQLDDINAKDKDGNYVWWEYYGPKGDWFYPREDGHWAKWIPDLLVDGYYDIQATFNDNMAGKDVQYIIYDPNGREIGRKSVKQTSVGWRTENLGTYYLKMGSYVKINNIPSQFNVDAIRFELIHGLHASYYNDPIYRNNINAIATPDVERIDSNVDFDWHSFGRNDPLPDGISDDGWWSADWTGFIYAPARGTYYFKLNSDDGSWLFIDGKSVVDNGGDHPPRDAIGSIDLTKGYHSIYVKYFESFGGEANIKLYWKPPSEADYKIVPPDVLFITPPEEVAPIMYLSKNAPASMNHGNAMTYTLYYHNFGSATASNIVLEDTLPSNVEFISASDSGTYDSTTKKVTWNIGSIAPLGRGSKTATVRIPGNVAVGTVINNEASISYDNNPPSATANAQTTVTGSNLPPDVSVGPTNGNTGGTPSVYWRTPITFSYHSCDTATGVDIRIHVNDGRPDITGSMTGSPPDWIYTTAFYPRHGRATVTYTVDGCTQNTVNFNIYIDPAGYIYDASTGARISGASVWLQRPDGAGGWENVLTGQTLPIMQPDVNPLITGADGQYQWDVLEGSYRVHVEAGGYYPADSIVVSIPPPVTDLHVGLTHLPDETPPASVTDLQNITFAQTYINWTWANPTDADFAKVMVYLNGVFQTNITTPTDYYNATGLTPDTQYTIGTHTADTSGNINQTWVNHTARTALIDTAPPVITNVSAVPTIDSAVIAWDTDEASDSLVKYGTSSGSYSFNVSSDEMTSSHSIPLTGLTSDTLYYYVVNSTDSQGNSAESTEFTFRTLMPPDTTPPVIESINLYPAITTAGSTINISVNASDNVSVVEVTADGSPLTYSDGLWQGGITAASSVGSYTFTINASDAAGNYVESLGSYTVVIPTGGVAITSVPKPLVLASGSSGLLNVKLISTANFDDTVEVTLDTSGLPPAYAADLSWFNRTSVSVKVPAGETVLVSFNVSVPSGVAGYRVFKDSAKSQGLNTTSMETGVLYVTP